jgi:hypothetical protein
VCEQPCALWICRLSSRTAPEQALSLVSAGGIPRRCPAA